MKMQTRILPAVRSVSEVFLNYTKKNRYVERFYHISEAKHHPKHLRATVRRGYLTWTLFKPMSVNASHRVIMMASFCLKCKESEQLDIF
jgi:hypothetical protein